MGREEVLMEARRRAEELRSRFGEDRVTDVVVEGSRCSFALEPFSPLGMRIEYDLDTGRVSRSYLCEELDPDW